MISAPGWTGCRPAADSPPAEPAAAPAAERTWATGERFVDQLQERTFRFFWETADAATGLAPDRWPTRSFASVSATGFALTTYPIGVEHGWVSREEAGRRTRDTLRFLWNAPQDSASERSSGYRGFFYHFLDPGDGSRYGSVELSTVDTALLVAGALFCRQYFDGDDPIERDVRAYADSLYRRVDWQWASVRPPSIGHGWTPEGGHLPYDWRGYNEAMLLYVLALGSPTFPVEPAAWDEWTSAYRWGEFFGQEHLGFGPLFGHQYTHVWIDFRGIRDAAGRKHGLDYFENSRRAVLAQRAYAIENPGGWPGYGERLWGLTACDGPVAGTFELDGKKREFHTYWARGASFTAVQDDGTIAPTAAAASIAFAPEVVLPVLDALREDWGEWILGDYGFLDSLNPGFRWEVPVQHGVVVPGVGWFDTDYLGIDQGPIVAMIENHRTGLVWRTMRREPAVRAGLAAAGFTGGWLDGDEPVE
jgi:hypothetical protein